MRFVEVVSRWWKWAGIVAVSVLLFVWCKKGLASSEMATWVQAFGALAAIVGVAWVANWQSFADDRRLEEQRKDEQRRVEREVANLSFDVTHFLIRNAEALQSTYGERFKISEVEFEELITRLTWARQLATSAQTVEDVLTLRESLVEATFIGRRYTFTLTALDREKLGEMRQYLEDARTVNSRLNPQRRGA